MTDAHQIASRAILVATLALLVAAAWSALDGRRTGGARDHRFAVDRLVIVVVALVAAEDLVGAFLFVTGARPADGLHLVYGFAAVVVLPLAWALGGRAATPAGAAASPGAGRTRLRRDAWLLGATALALGIELRLVATG